MVRRKERHHLLLAREEEAEEEIVVMTTIADTHCSHLHCRRNRATLAVNLAADTLRRDAVVGGAVAHDSNFSRRHDVVDDVAHVHDSNCHYHKFPVRHCTNSLREFEPQREAVIFSHFQNKWKHIL